MEENGSKWVETLHMPSFLSREMLLVWVIEEDVGDELEGRVFVPIYSRNSPWSPRNLIPKFRTGGCDVEELRTELERLGSEYVSYKSKRRMWIILVVSRLKWRKRKRCGQFCDQGLKGDACKKLRKEVGASLRIVIGVESSNNVRIPKSKDTKSKNRVLKNTKSSSTYVWKTSSSASIDSNKCLTKDSNVCQTNACVSNSKTVNACVNAVNDGSNIVCISCGKDVFLHSHEKCVARHALSRNSSVKKALFHSPVAAKSKNLGATSVVAKSRLSVANTPNNNK
ncbi:hypothetical protein Tco_0396039 [Tanacetum coccineum]